MNKYIISTGTVTYALKAKSLLVRKGFKAYVERSSAPDRKGCGYGVVVTGDVNAVQGLLRQAGIKILDIKLK